MSDDIATQDKKKRETALMVMKKLDDWLLKIDAVCAYQLVRRGPGNKPHSYIEAWMANGRVFFVVRYAGEFGGWDIYTSNNDNHIDNTFADVEKRIGLTKE